MNINEKVFNSIVANAFQQDTEKIIFKTGEMITS